MTKKEFNYKEAKEQIQKIVDRIENDEPEIDELSDLVKKALQLVKTCKEKLRKTEEDLNRSLGENE